MRNELEIMEEKQSSQVKYRPGDTVTLEVVRISEIGAFLDAGSGSTSDDILLHHQQQNKPLQIGDKVTVWLYLDPHKRLTASTKLPNLKEGQLGYAKVLSITKHGGFVDIGAERGIFLPYSEMHGHVNPDQMIWVKLYRDKTGRQAVTMRVEEDIVAISKPAKDVKVGDMVEGTIYNILPEGFFIITRKRFLGFLHRSEAGPDRLDFGQMISARVAYIREDGRLNLSMRAQKENALVPDSDKIMAVLQQRGGKMPYGDGTSPEIIKMKFNLSKAAFKRALGHLMKEGKVRQEDGWTILVKDDKVNGQISKK